MRVLVRGTSNPSNIVFLTCDAYGVLPPVSKLSDDHDIYSFLSGYTAKVTGTERGVTEPTATFGAAFLPLHPTKYADLLQKKLQKHNTSVYLVNTDWNSGGYGVGKRMSIKDTRACIDAILDGSIKNSKFSEDPNFGFSVPKKLGEISENVLNTSEAWSEKEAYDVTAKKLAGMFQENFKRYVSTGVTDYSKFGPKL
ncbi:Phosphoenolpyruvate carboxykinase [Phytophthora infestans]|uniref:Phosphoenolpyruvate carboxykinase n=1 Tax=Phytophthora infestans TaxID=4787 RepID=A0A833WCP2_PHYIN|nr:Phosphoenolpyruvate carboxykinase [Phytophthora infestans]KAF4146601.1 Phosphoenolpyruvate carboxykinase [Phytophthora infestans]